MILIWFNPIKEFFYQRHLKHCFSENDYRLGFENSYGHILVQIFVVNDFDIVNVYSFHSYLYNLSFKKEEKTSILTKIKKFFRSWYYE